MKESLSLFAKTSMWLNGAVLKRNPNLTICAEVHQRKNRVSALILDSLVFFIFKEVNHCQNQWETYQNILSGDINT